MDGRASTAILMPRPSQAARVVHGLDAEEERARQSVAASSSARRVADAASLRKSRADLSAQLKATGAKTDSDITDEEAGRRRVELAAASSARRGAESSALGRRAQRLRKRMDASGPRTDSDITDEQAGRRRVELAAESVTRRVTEAEALDKQNTDMRQRMHSTGTRTDSDIRDEAAGRKRVEMAAASAARREAESALLEQQNEEMKERLKAVKSRTDDGDGGGIFSGLNLKALDRDTAVWRASYLKFEVKKMNQQVAGRDRETMAALRSQRDKQEAERLARARQLIRERMRDRRRLRRLQSELQRSKGAIVDREREEEERRAARAEEQHRRHWETARKRVEAANELDAKLDASEAAADAKERHEGTQLKLSLSQAMADTRAAVYSEKREIVEHTIAARAGALSARSSAFSPRRGRDVREASKGLRQQKQASEDDYLAWARANRAEAEATRARARKSLLALLRTRQKNCKKERANDSFVTDEKRRILTNNRKEVNAVYRRRFASKQEVARMGIHSDGEAPPSAAETDSKGDASQSPPQMSASWWGTRPPASPRATSVASPPGVASSPWSLSPRRSASPRARAAVYI